MMYSIQSSHPDRSLVAAARQRNCNRGVVLSEQGWQKLSQVGVFQDQWGNRYTYERLSERSLLNERTVSRIFSCEVKVDKRSLKIFFAAFGLHLNSDDYVSTECDLAAQSITGFSY